MSTPIKIFICYKKRLSWEENGKTIEKENSQAQILHFILGTEKELFDPWLDEPELSAGVAWETEIYNRILDSDILLVLIGRGTSQSQWVQREIALATALGISVVPLGFDVTKSEFEVELKTLNIDHLQGKITHNLKLPTRDPLLTEIRGDLIKASRRTKEEQERKLSALLARRNPPVIIAPAPNNQKAATFVLEFNGRKHNLHIASGDLSKFRNIDILVNSENDYMQMARFFESRTVSAILRRMGARVENKRFLDTIQEELDLQVKERGGRPVDCGDVFATSAGDKESELMKKNARYILHVAAVEAVLSDNKVSPFKEPYQIEMCVRACLFKMKEINELKGVISPAGTRQREFQESLAAEGKGITRSIIFPLFGTGQGGASPKDVLEPIIQGINEFLQDSENKDLADVLDDIYISAYKQQDVDDVIQMMRAKFNS